jgi:hypothetical protein
MAAKDAVVICVGLEAIHVIFQRGDIIRSRRPVGPHSGDDGR